MGRGRPVRLPGRRGSDTEPSCPWGFIGNRTPKLNLCSFMEALEHLLPNQGPATPGRRRKMRRRRWGCSAGSWPPGSWQPSRFPRAALPHRKPTRLPRRPAVAFGSINAFSNLALCSSGAWPETPTGGRRFLLPPHVGHPAAPGLEAAGAWGWSAVGAGGSAPGNVPAPLKNKTSDSCAKQSPFLTFGTIYISHDWHLAV